MAVRKITVAGKTKFTEIYIPHEKRERKKKNRPTAAAVQEHNRKAAIRNLSILLNSNYADGDLHLILTYRERQAAAQAQREFNNYIRRLNRIYKKKEIPFKWTAVTEMKNENIHHHMIINCPEEITEAEITEKWTKGFVIRKTLNSDGDYRKLAEYLIKETDKTFRDPAAAQKQRYRHGRDVVYPDTEEYDKASAKYLFQEPKATKGWIIDQDSVKKGTNPVTGTPYLHYVEVLAGKKTYRTWRRGKKKRYNVFYYPVPEEEEQLSFGWEES